MKKRLLCLSYRFPPEHYPLAIRVKYFLEHLRENWDVTALTAAPEAKMEGIDLHVRPGGVPRRWIRWMRRMRMGKLVDLLLWPDPFLPWVVPAFLEAKRLVHETKPDALVVFMMPYSTGLVALLLKKLTGLPLIVNLNDSPTCSDMNPSFPTRLHYRMAHWLEDAFVQQADAVVYVSRRNMERVRDRQPPEHQDKFHLIRRGVRPLPPQTHAPERGRVLRIAYTGGMGGWYQQARRDRTPSVLQRLNQAWKRWGRYVTKTIDYTPHGPTYIGQAIRQVLDAHPEWKGRIRFEIRGNTVDRAVVDRVLDQQGLTGLVEVHPPVPHTEALQAMQAADLLFMALPTGQDGAPGGRISAKTYEYLMTDRPILAALPPGENREYLTGKPGVHLTGPYDVDAMAAVITECAERTFAGDPLLVDRSALAPTLLSTARADAFERVVASVLDRSASTSHDSPQSATRPRERERRNAKPETAVL